MNICIYVYMYTYLYAHTYVLHHICAYAHEFACLHHMYQITVVKIDEFSDDAGLIMTDRTDPFVSLTLGNQTFKTAVKDNAGGKNVEFNERLSFKKDRTSTTLKVCNSERIYPHTQTQTQRYVNTQTNTNKNTHKHTPIIICGCVRILSLVNHHT